MKRALDFTPGPGSYELNSQNTTRPTTKSSNVVGKEAKFNPNVNSYIRQQMSGEKLGPGAYYNQEKTSMVKKSFNMALEGFKFA